jgi:hypothetical protein
MSQEKRTIDIMRAESKLALALFAHIRIIVAVATKQNGLARPIQMDHGHLLLRAASFRALYLFNNRIK